MDKVVLVCHLKDTPTAAWIAEVTRNVQQRQYILLKRGHVV